MKINKPKNIKNMKELVAFIIAEFLAAEVFSYKNILDKIKEIINYLNK